MTGRAACPLAYARIFAAYAADLQQNPSPSSAPRVFPEMLNPDYDKRKMISQYFLFIKKNLKTARAIRATHPDRLLLYG
jgi:hypothetical protein